MIVEWLLDLIQGLLVGILSLLPDSDLDVTGPISGMVGQLGALNYFLPIAETFAVVIGILVVFPALMGVSLALWVAAQIRGSSSVG